MERRILDDIILRQLVHAKARITWEGVGEEFDIIQEALNQFLEEDKKPAEIDKDLVIKSIQEYVRKDCDEDEYRIDMDGDIRSVGTCNYLVVAGIADRIISDQKAVEPAPLEANRETLTKAVQDFISTSIFFDVDANGNIRGKPSLMCPILCIDKLIDAILNSLNVAEAKEDPAIEQSEAKDELVLDKTVTAPDLLEQVKDIIESRGQQRDSDRERSLPDIAKIFKAMTDIELSEEQVCKLLLAVKLGRMKQGGFHADDYIDAIGYTALTAEAAINAKVAEVV